MTFFVFYLIAPLPALPPFSPLSGCETSPNRMKRESVLALDLCAHCLASHRWLDLIAAEFHGEFILLCGTCFKLLTRKIKIE